MGYFQSYINIMRSYNSAASPLLTKAEDDNAIMQNSRSIRPSLNP